MRLFDNKEEDKQSTPSLEKNMLSINNFSSTFDLEADLSPTDSNKKMYEELTRFGSFRKKISKKRKLRELLGNISPKAEEKVIEDMSKYSNMSFDSSFSQSHTANEDDKGLLTSLLTNYSSFKPFDPAEEAFSDESYEGKNEEDHKRMLKHLHEIENNFTCIILWIAHGILGSLPTIYAAFGYVRLYVSVVITSTFMF